MISPSFLLDALRRAEELLRGLGLSSSHSVQKCIECVSTGKQHPAPNIKVTIFCSNIVVVERPEPVHLAPGEDRIQAQLREAEGAKSLLLEIVRRAAYDWVLYRSSTRLEQKQLAMEAFVWLFEEEEGHPDHVSRMTEHREFTSFLSICDALDMDAGRVRFYIKQLTPTRVSSGRLPRVARPKAPTPLQRKAVDFDELILSFMDAPSLLDGRKRGG